MLASTWETPAHKATPASPPINTGRMACHSTSLITSPPFAPSAIRMPISRTLRLTLYDTMPYTPMEASSSASTPSAP